MSPNKKKKEYVYLLLSFSNPVWASKKETSYNHN